MEVEGVGEGLLVLKCFVEKLDLVNVEVMLVQGNFLWNVGIFLFLVCMLIVVFEIYVLEFMVFVCVVLIEVKCDFGFLCFVFELWDWLFDLLIDYVVLEKVDNLLVVCFFGYWLDLGGWDVIWCEVQDDYFVECGVVIDDCLIVIDCDNVLLWLQDEGIEVVGIGLQDIMVVLIKDVVLVVDMNWVQDVKKVVVVLKFKGVWQVESFLCDNCLWGWYEMLVLVDRFQVKWIVVNLGVVLLL